MTPSKKIISVFLLAHTGFTWAQTETLNTSAQVGPATSSCGTTNVPMYELTYNVTSGTAVFTDIVSFTTSGTYTASDISNIKIYQTNFSVFNTTNLLATITTGLGPGTHTFPVFSYSMSAPVTRYFWITVDLTGSAVSGHTIICNVITTAMTTITGTENPGTSNVGGTQTITCTLPVELQNFSGTNKGNVNELEWTTASETNNQYFTLERSTDGLLFTPVSVINGSGNSNHQHHYSVLDHLETATEEIYYRLWQTDYDGGVQQIGGIISLQQKQKSWRIFPNPVTTYLTVEGLATNAVYALRSLDGKTVSSGNILPNQRLELSGISKGLYLLEIREAEKTRVEKLVVE